MRNIALVIGALVVLTVGFVLATGGGDEGSGTSAGTETTQATAAPAATATTDAAATQSTPTTTTPPKPTVPTIVFADGKPVGGIRKLSFDKGDDVAFKVRSDVAEEVHVHGFDKMEDVEAGGTVSFAFPAKFDGKYEVEMEGTETQIASLVVEP